MSYLEISHFHVHKTGQVMEVWLLWPAIAGNDEMVQRFSPLSVQSEKMSHVNIRVDVVWLNG